ncbi:MAG: dethiobiotin synthase [Oleiphilaceae bacterium]|nr:dethiobiotin synthase [Oleiphilaceae bacterium]
MAKHSFFVTGTDTGVGKTLVTAAILHAASAQGRRTLAMKPIASGCDQTPDGLRNEDALILQQAMTETLPYEQVNPIAMAPAIAPHVAARQAGRQLTAQRLVGFCRGLQMRPADLFLVEGAGGWRVPLNEQETYAQVPREMTMPVILVVPLQLGCINHALLTAEAIRADGLTVAGWVANRPNAEVMMAEEDTLAYLLNHMWAPCLGVIPWQSQADPALAAEYLDLRALFE